MMRTVLCLQLLLAAIVAASFSSIAVGVDSKTDRFNDLKTIRKAAESGDANAQATLGYMYTFGKGVAKDYSEAVKWFRKSADQGNGTAQMDLGEMYGTGTGVVKDDAEAVKWFLKSANQGNATAQMNLGHMYATGKGVAKNEAEAVKWFRKSAEQGMAGAQVNLGMAYLDGHGIPKDPKEAYKWFRKAADQGNAYGQFVFGLVLSKNVEPHFVKLSGGGEREAGAFEDVTEALKWFRKSAEQGCGEAQYFLGVTYANGKGIATDYVQAYAWLDIAVRNEFMLSSPNSADARRERDVIAAEMTQEQIAQAQKLSQAWKPKTDATREASGTAGVLEWIEGLFEGRTIPPK